MTFFTAIPATPNTPHSTFLFMSRLDLSANLVQFQNQLTLMLELPAGSRNAGTPNSPARQLGILQKIVLCIQGIRHELAQALASQFLVAGILRPDIYLGYRGKGGRYDSRSQVKARLIKFGADE